MTQEFANGIGWGQAKKELFTLVNAELEEPRARYMELLEKPELIEQKLKEGGEKARALAAPLLELLRDAVGIRSLG